MTDPKETLEPGEKEDIEDVLGELDDFIEDIEYLRGMAVALSILAEELEKKIDLKEEIGTLTEDKKLSSVDESIEGFNGFISMFLKKTSSLDPQIIERIRKAANPLSE